MRARKIAPVGMAPAITGLCWVLCTWEARMARRGHRPYEAALPGSGLVGGGLGGRAVKVAWLGDSLAAGLGCDQLEDTPAHLTAQMLERPVELAVLAVPGARVAQVLAEQLPHLGEDTDLVVLCVGANDVAAGTPRSRYAGAVDELLERLAPTPVVMLTLPDMSMADRMAEPLRSLAGARARWFEAARVRVAARHPHVTSVDIASRPAGVTRKAGRLMLCADRFHPGAVGYRVWAERIAAACHALLEPDHEASADSSLVD